jgi:hypothetical protein
MKKASFTTTIVATLAVAVISTMTSFAQSPYPMNQPGEHIAPKIRVSASKGVYNKFSLIDASVSGTATGTASQTVSATVAVAKISGTGFYATASATTATSTLAKTTVKKGKITNKELIALILGSPNNVKDYELVWVAVDGTILDGSDYVLGARKKKTTEILYRLPERTEDGDLVKSPSKTGVDAFGYMTFLNEQKTLKNGATARKGYGDIGLGIVSPTPQALGIEGVTTLATSAYASVTFQEQSAYNTNGSLNTNTKASVRSVSAQAWGN